jgi:response regulator of citrate/malate metabolism
MQTLSKKIIKNAILQNYVDYQYLFVEFQSKFLSGLHNRYQSLENGNLVLYYAKQVHQDILRQKDYNLNFNTSHEKFWENYDDIKPKQISIIKIAKDTSLPKETARRKILQLIKQKVLNKKNRNIGWRPNEQYKKSYDLFIKEEIKDVARMISYICKKINFSISTEAVVNELEEKFSFYWFHYLGAQLEYLKLWSKQLNDLELGLIFLQVAHVFTSKAKKKNLSHKDLFKDPSLLKEFISASVSATSISDVTNISRATCVRKLETLIKLKMISQDKISKRYYIIPNAITKNLISEKLIKKIVVIFSEFFFICVRAINIKTSS